VGAQGVYSGTSGTAALSGRQRHGEYVYVCMCVCVHVCMCVCAALSGRVSHGEQHI
jgi:hypothetical protein